MAFLQEDDERSTLEAARELKHLMISRATDTRKIDRRAYLDARRAVVSDATVAKVVPECVRFCREPDEVWSYVKAQGELDTYASRREFFRAQFEPLFSALERFQSSPLDDLVTAGTQHLDSVSIGAAWTKAIERRTADPEGAVTAARTLLESTCKTILDDRNVAYSERDDLPALYRALQKELKLAPTDHTEEQFKAILGACATVVQNLGSLRNRISDSHGPGRKVYRPAERHAALAVNLAGSMALFLMETHESCGA